MKTENNDSNNAAINEAAEEIKKASAELEAAKKRLDELKAKSAQETEQAQKEAAFAKSVVQPISKNSTPQPQAAPVNTHNTSQPTPTNAHTAQVPPTPGAQVPPAPGTQAPPAPGATPPQGAAPTSNAQPYYYQQAQVVSSKDHVAAGLLAIFLGCLGIHKFYLGYNTAGFIMLAVTIIGSILSFGLAFGVVVIIGIIEGIIYLSKSQDDFDRMYVFNKREWF